MAGAGTQQQSQRLADQKLFRAPEQRGNGVIGLQDDAGGVGHRLRIPRKVKELLVAQAVVGMLGSLRRCRCLVIAGRRRIEHTTVVARLGGVHRLLR